MTITRIAVLGAIGCLAIYLFISAPPPLADEIQDQAGCYHPINTLFDGVNAINQAARDIYTKRIVGGGLQAGLKFGEEWQEPGIEQGPLPALFLRATAAQLERMPPPLGLYLGSDAPINKSNLFGESQAGAFVALKETRRPVYSEDENSGFVAMYPDIAAVTPCVSCHNEHPDSPKDNWRLNDVMGATTWTYPHAEISSARYLGTIETMFMAVEATYGAYLAKAQVFEVPVEISDRWPGELQRSLPSVTVFMAEVRAVASPDIVRLLIQGRRPRDPIGEQSKLATEASATEAPCGI